MVYIRSTTGFFSRSPEHLHRTTDEGNVNDFNSTYNQPLPVSPKLQGPFSPFRAFIAQQAARSVLHLGHDSHQNSSHKPTLPQLQYTPIVHHCLIKHHTFPFIFHAVLTLNTDATSGFSAADRLMDQVISMHHFVLTGIMQNP